MSKNENRKTKQAKSDIENVLKSKEKAFVLFYASWCPFSQRFLPIFEDYAKSNPQECMSVVIDDKPDLCEKYEIDYHPFRTDAPVTEALIAYLQSRIGV